MAFSPFGDALRSVRDSALRADASGIHVKGMQWAAFVVAGLLAGLAGALFVFFKGSTSPEVLTVGKSVDGLGNGRAHVCNPVTNSHIVCPLLLGKKKKIIVQYIH